MCMIKKRMKARVILLCLLFAPIVVLAATGGDTTVPVPSNYKEYIDLFKWFISIVLAGQFFWIQKYMRDNEKKHDGHESGRKALEERSHDVHREQWEAIGNLAQTLNQLVGEHRQAVGSHRRASDPPNAEHTHCRHTNGDES